MPYVTNLRVVAAICGNFWQESTVNPGIWENLTPNITPGGYGLGQWTDNPGQNLWRRTDLFNYLETHGYAYGSGEGQLEYLIYENTWVPSLFVQSNFNTLYDFLYNNNSTSLYDCVYEFMYHWEGINDGSDTVRKQYADRFYNLFQNDPGTRQAWTSGNFYCTQTQADNNALLIMDYLMGNSPTPPTPTPPTNEEILAMFMHVMRLKKRGADIHIVL